MGAAILLGICCLFDCVCANRARQPARVVTVRFACCSLRQPPSPPPSPRRIALAVDRRERSLPRRSFWHFAPFGSHLHLSLAPHYAVSARWRAAPPPQQIGADGLRTSPPLPPLPCSPRACDREWRVW